MMPSLKTISVDGTSYDIEAVNGIPVGGTTNQVLAKKSNSNLDVEWVTQSGGGGGAVDSVNGQTGAVELDADDVGAIAAPASPSNGQFLSWNGSSWVAVSLPLYDGSVV